METVEPTTAVFSPAPPAGGVARGFAVVAALLVLLIGSIFSLGTVLLAPVGMAIGAYLWRRRGRTLSATGHWLAAAIASTAVLIAYAGVFASAMSKDTWAKARQAADSAQKASANQAPPAWLQRLAPGAAQRAAQRPTSERAQTFGLAFGAAFVAMFLVGLFGTFGWLGGMLLGFGIGGRWPGQRAAASG